ncbi:MAG TPA: hypothetical protein VL970_14050 [Candidatus Acidoferrales bacterium]|nr:hypothetical protein [Candidatus Acidoferrales bacterium]
MNLIKQLFGRHSPAQESTTTSYNWPGHSGREYHFDIYALDTALQPLPGVYIYAKLLADGGWEPIYIAQTRGLHQRLEGHVTMDDAIAHGATHLHAHYCEAGQGARCAEERDLLGRWQPECNDRLED